MTKTKQLHDWVLEFIKHRDLIRRDVKSIDDTSDMLTVTHSSKTHIYLIRENFSTFSDDLAKLTAGTHLSLVFPNEKKLIKEVIDNWKELSKHQFLSLYFVNPGSTTDQRWIIFPHTHNKITEPKKLKQGLLALYQNVGEY